MQQHFAKKSASVPTGQSMAKSANTTGMMPSINRNQIGLPNVNVSFEQNQSTQQSDLSNKAGNGSNIKNHIKIMQTSNGDRNQLLLVSNPEIIAKKGLQQFKGASHMANNTGPLNDISLPSPVNVKHESQDSSVINKKTNQMSIASPATSLV